MLDASWGWAHMYKSGSRKADGKLYVSGCIRLTTSLTARWLGSPTPFAKKQRTLLEDSRIHASSSTHSSFLCRCKHLAACWFCYLVSGRIHVKILNESVFISISHSLSGASQQLCLASWHPLWLWLLVCFLSLSFLLGLSSHPCPISLLPEICGNLSFTEGSSPVLFISAELYLFYASHLVYLFLNHIFSSVNLIWYLSLLFLYPDVQYPVEILVDILSETELRACPHLGLRQVSKYSLWVCTTVSITGYIKIWKIHISNLIIQWEARNIGRARPRIMDTFRGLAFWLEWTSEWLATWLHRNWKLADNMGKGIW